MDEMVKEIFSEGSYLYYLYNENGPPYIDCQNILLEKGMVFNFFDGDSIKRYKVDSWHLCDNDEFEDWGAKLAVNCYELKELDIEGVIKGIIRDDKLDELLG